MKYKSIMTFFGVSTPLCVLIRTLQILFTTDEKGFAAKDYEVLNLNMTLLLFAAAIVTAVLGMLVYRRPADSPRVNVAIGVISVLFGVWILYEAIFADFASVVPVWQISLSRLFGLLSAVLLVVYGGQMFFDYRLPQLLFIAPVLFWVVRLICIFTTINTLALTTGHILLLAAHCAILFFMLEFAKLINGMDEDYNFKKLLASGLCAVNLCAVSTVPYLIAAAFGTRIAANESTSSMVLTLLAGAFILTFLLSHFGIKRPSSRVR